jgi:hypothetical protein
MVSFSHASLVVRCFTTIHSFDLRALTCLQTSYFVYLLSLSPVSVSSSLSLSLSLALPFYRAHPHTHAHTPAHHIHLCIRTHAHIGFLNASIIYRNYPRAFTPPLAFLYLPVPPRRFFCTYLYHPANFLLLPLISTRVYPVYTRKSCSTA